MNTDAHLSAALRSVAGRWAEPEHPAREEASAATLAADNRFTAESIAFAVNHAMDLIARGEIEAWVGLGGREKPPALGVISMGRTPLEGLFETAGALTLGFNVHLRVGAASPALLPTFLDEVTAESGSNAVTISAEGAVFDAADSLVGLGTESERGLWAERAERSGVDSSRCLLRPVRKGVAIIDGSEDRKALSGLAEDILLHEGGTPYSVRLVFAPEDLEPDSLLETLAGFRELHPPHASTDGSLAMQAGFLKAMKAPHAVGPGFLVSKGDPDVQSGAHLRWVGYADLGDVAQWLTESAELVQFVAAEGDVAGALGTMASVPTIIQFGDAHRPRVGQPPLTKELGSFLRGL